MTVLENDVFPVNPLNKNAAGGTELIANELKSRIDPDILNNFQIHFSRVYDRNLDKIQLLYLHDLAEDPAASRTSDPMFRNTFANLIFVSNWQLNKFIDIRGVEWERSIIMKNAIVPFSQDVFSKKTPGKIKIIHQCAPHKGLAIVVPVFVELAKNYPNIELDLFSSFGLYGWEERDAQYSELLKICDEHPQINNYGAKPNEVVRNALETSDIFFLPSMFAETSCISLMEAMSAGCICIHPNYGALPETSGGLTLSYGWMSNPQDHANRAYHMLKLAIDNYEFFKGDDFNHLIFQKKFADISYNWKDRAGDWDAYLRSLINLKGYKNNG